MRTSIVRHPSYRGGMTTIEGYRIRPLDPTTWDAYAAFMERHNGVFGGCWCTYFHTMASEKTFDAQANRDLKEQLVREGRAHAALVLDGDEAVAWCQYGSPEELPNIHHRKQYLAEADVLPDYRLTCIFVDRDHRRQGVTEVAIQGALDLIAQAGGGVVEGYPHETPTKKVSSSFLYNATRTVYERMGFEYVRPKGLKNTVMRRTVEPR
jgi:GNAT superfamily N-acetyltransferase